MAVFLLRQVRAGQVAMRTSTYLRRAHAAPLRVADRRLADLPVSRAGALRSPTFALYPICVVRRPLIDRAGDLPNLVRWAGALAERPGVERGMKAAA